MVHIKDEGSHFDAPIDAVWAYLRSGEDHGESHKSSRNQKMTPINETTFLISQEQNMNGRWTKVANRITVFPPVAMAIEVVEGPMTGTKMVNVYTSKGNQTGIDVYGEFKVSGVPDAQLEPMVRSNLSTVFDEDTAGIKAFTAKR
jgi:hypothetical protein